MSSKKKLYDLYIGIDPGVNTGVAIYSKPRKILIRVDCVGATLAHDFVAEFAKKDPTSIFVRIEDARKRKWFGKTDREVLQGAGSVKRDCQLWEELLTRLEIPFELVAPKENKTKVDSATFKKVTKWTGRTNEHGRDAAFLVYGF